MTQAPPLPATIIEAGEISADLAAMTERHKREFEDLAARQSAEFMALVSQVETLLSEDGNDRR